MSAPDFILTQDIAAHGGCPPASCCGSLDLRLGDCMDVMKTFPDGHFDLAIVDPPYGIGAHEEQGLGDGRNGNRKESKWIGGKWDQSVPSAEYFAELRRVSKHQIVWGGNYFDLPPSRGFLIWDKVQRIDQADCEMAWTSLGSSARIFTFARGNLQGFRNPDRFHPTEKPVKLYSWIFANYATPGMRVLDTHMGSGSIAIAAHYAGVHLTACEIDADYFAAATARIERETRQTDLFIHHNT